jgi:hypothetical protein
VRDREGRRGEADRAVDALFAELLRAGEDAAALREAMRSASPDDAVLVAVLRRAVPVRLLEQLAAEPPWCDRPLVLGAVVRNPRVPRSLGLKLLQFLFWHDLAQVAANPWTQGAIRVRAEALLKDMIEEMRLGDKIALARIATPPVIVPLLQLTDPKILEAALLNPRLREEDLLQQIRSETVTTVLLESAAATSRWGGQYAVRLGLVLQPRTPLALALAQVSGLVRRDLLRVAETPGLRPLLQAAALRVAAGQ